MTKYSIIITVYNGEKYIKKCIDSIMNQTLKNFNLIIIDDGSTDNTKQIISDYLKNDNVEYYYKKNTGVADSRNYGIKKVKTKYFLFVDSDDYIKNDLIETIDKYDDYDILSFKAIKVDSNYKEIEFLEKGIFNLIDGRNYILDLIKNNYFFLVPWGFIYNTEFFKHHKFKYSKGYIHEDTGLTPIIILESKNIISIDYYGYYYYQSDDSITRTMDDKKIEYSNNSLLYQYDKLIEYIDKYDDEILVKQFKYYFSNMIFWHGYDIFRQKKSNINEYIKQIKKRKIDNNITVNNIKNFFQKLLSKISYKMSYYIFNFVSKFIIKKLRQYKKKKN